MNTSFGSISSSSADCCGGLKAIAPVVNQSKSTQLVGGTGGILVAPIATGQPALMGGSIENKGCKAIQATINYLTGADCDECTADTLTTVTQTIKIEGNEFIALPNGAVTGITYETGSIDDAGAFTASAVTAGKQVVRYYSAYVPSCNPVIV